MGVKIIQMGCVRFMLLSTRRKRTFGARTGTSFVTPTWHSPMDGRLPQATLFRFVAQCAYILVLWMLLIVIRQRAIPVNLIIHYTSTNVRERPQILVQNTRWHNRCSIIRTLLIYNYQDKTSSSQQVSSQKCNLSIRSFRNIPQFMQYPMWWFRG